jgi:hypothetical protein
VPYQRSVHGRVFCVLWRETTIDDLDRLRREIPDQARFIKERLIYVSISDAQTPPPGEVERRALIKLAEDMLPHLELIFLVIRAEGFKGSVLRSAMAGMLLLSKHRKVVQIVGTIDEALYYSRGLLDESAVRRQLARDGMLLPRDANEAG